MEASDVTDDVLIAVFKTLAAECSASYDHKEAVARFIWFRTTLPLVCKRWYRLALDTPTLWRGLIIDPTLEVQHVKRLGRAAELPGSSTEREVRGGSGASTPARGHSPVLGSSPDSDTGGYWSSIYAPQQAGLSGGSPSAHFHKQLSRISLSRHRHQLHAHAVIHWLHEHPAAARSVERLTLDLTHHSHHDFDRRQLEVLLQALPRLHRLHMTGAVDGTDAYEPLGRVRTLHSLQLLSASQACLDAGLMALSFLPCLRHLAVTFDIRSASPWCLNDLPTGLVTLRLGGVWLEQLPELVTELTGLTSITLERCQVDQNPLPLLLTLPQLAAVSIRNVSRVGGNDLNMPRLVPMTSPQQQLSQLQQKLAKSASAGCPGNGLAQTATAADAAAGGSSQQGSISSIGTSVTLRLGSAPQLDLARVRSNNSASTSSLLLVNTSITSLALVDVQLQQLPSCISQLVTLQDLNLALNHDMAVNPGSCLPVELATLSTLQGLCLGHCGLTQLPAVIAECVGLTRLEVQGNALSLAGLSWRPADIGFKESLQVLDIGSQGTGGTRMRGIPAWIGSCSALRELKIGCYCLGHSVRYPSHSDGSTHAHMPGAGTAVYAPPFSPVGGGGGACSATPAGCSPVRGSNARSTGSAAVTSHAAFGRPSFQAGVSASSAGNATAGSPFVGSSAGEGLSLQQLPELLPRLDVLRIDGGVWEQRAVRDALQLVRRLGSSGSRLKVILPL